MSGSGKGPRVQAMFARIVSRYDLMNRLMTGGMDRGWRRLAARLCEPQGKLALDLATGTGDLAVELVRQGARQVVGVDFCPPMLGAASEKTGLLGSRIRLLAGDAMALPFADESFDCAANGFLLRNVADLPRALRELARVLKPDGRLVCLEITHPPSRLFRALFQPYFYGLVPWLGSLISGDGAAYKYLPDSLSRFPDAPRLAQSMREAGFSEVNYRYLSFGAMAVHVGVKGLEK